MKPSEVLLIEDSAGDALLITQILEESPIPVRVQHAWDGSEALLMLETHVSQPDLVIMDWNMPMVSGSGVLERYHPANVPVIVFSSSWNETERWRSLELGAQEFVRKPMNLQAFKDAVCGILERWAGKRPAAGPAGRSA